MPQATPVWLSIVQPVPGSVSSRLTPVAVPGPLFVMVTVNCACSPAETVPLPTFVTVMSGQLTTIVADEELFVWFVPSFAAATVTVLTISPQFAFEVVFVISIS